MADSGAATEFSANRMCSANMPNVLRYPVVCGFLYRVMLAAMLVFGGGSFSHAAQIGVGSQHDDAHGSLAADAHAAHGADAGDFPSKVGDTRSRGNDQNSIHCDAPILFSFADVHDHRSPIDSVSLNHAIDTVLAAVAALDPPPPRA